VFHGRLFLSSSEFRTQTRAAVQRVGRCFRPNYNTVRWLFKGFLQDVHKFAAKRIVYFGVLWYALQVGSFAKRKAGKTVRRLFAEKEKL